MWRPLPTPRSRTRLPSGTTSSSAVTSGCGVPSIVGLSATPTSLKKVNRMLEVGAKLPAIEVADDSGTVRSTEDFLGRPLVLYFYPKDDTPG